MKAVPIMFATLAIVKFLPQILIYPCTIPLLYFFNSARRRVSKAYFRLPFKDLPTTFSQQLKPLVD